MTTLRWVGNAPKIAQVQTYAFAGTWEADDIIRVNFGTKSYDFTAGTTVVATILATMVSTWQGLSKTEYPEFAEVEPAVNGTSLQLTARTPGQAFVCSLTPLEANGSSADSQTIEGAGTVTTGTTATANSGPNDWRNIANWSTGAIPVDSDDIIIENNAIDILYGLDQSSIQPTTLTIAASYTGKIGLPRRGGSSSAGYQEYRDDYLKIGPATLTIGRGEGSGSGRIKIDTGTDQLLANIYSTGQAVETGIPSLLIKGSHASSVLNLNKGNVGLAIFGGETAQFTTIRVGFDANQAGDSTLFCGSGLTIATLVQNGGDVTLNGAVTTVTKTAGVLTILGTGAVSTLNELGGTTYYASSGTISTLVVGAGGTIDFSTDNRSRTVSACTCHAGSKFIDPVKTTGGVAIAVSNVGLAPLDTLGVTLDLGTNFTITRS